MNLFPAGNFKQKHLTASIRKTVKITKFEFVKRGREYVRVEKVINKWYGKAPTEPDIS